MTDILLQIGAEFPGADKVNEQLNKIDRSLVDSVRAINRFDKEFKTLSNAAKNQKLTQEGFNRALQQSVSRLLETGNATNTQTQAVDRNTQALERSRQAAERSNRTQQAARTQFLATANSIAVLDGPLGGVASRFSAFGVLIGRIGIPLAAFSVSMTTLGVVANRAIRQFAEFEVQLSVIENRLNSTSSQVNLTSQSIVNMTRAIAQGSLASERELLSAAGQVLTFGNITTDVFEQVLRSATDLAASGFGTVESAASMLSRALEDPRQSLTSLSRAGITFTRQQREMVISMIDAGRQAEAMSIILEQVNRQVGGAAEAQARGTIAGQFDTIGQAVRLANEQFAEFILNEVGVRRVIEALAEVSDRFIEASKEPTIQEQVDAQRELLRLLKEEEIVQNALSSAALARGQITQEEYDRREKAILNEIRLLEQKASIEARITAQQEAASTIARRSTAIEAIRSEIEVRQESLFLTQEQLRVNRELAAQGFGAGGVDAMAEEFAKIIQTMRDTGASGMAIERETERLNARLAEAKTLSEALFDILTDEELSRQFNSINQSLTQQNETQRIINEALAQGATQAEARLAAEDEMQNNLIRQLTERLGAESAVVQEITKQVEESRKLRDQNEALTEERRKLEQATGFLENLEEENRILELQLGLMEDGVDEADARRKAEELIRREMIEQEILFLTLTDLADGLNDQEVERLNTLRQITAEMDKQAGLETAVREKTERLRSARGGGGGTSGPDAIERLQQQLDREIQLLQVFGDQRLEMEARFRVYDAMSQAGIQLSEQQQQALVDQIMLTHELKRAEEERIETQRKLEQAQERAAQRMTDLFMAATQGGDAFKRTLANIIQELARMAAMRAFQSIVGGSSGGLLTSLFGFADGGVFQGGNVKAFAKGGVVDGPTMFPMKGATGLMGEAGPEAIIPLKRARDGSLGVQGGVTNAVSVTYAPQISVKGSGEEVAELRQEIAKMNAEAPARIISTIQKAQKKRVL